MPRSKYRIPPKQFQGGVADADLRGRFNFASKELMRLRKENEDLRAERDRLQAEVDQFKGQERRR